MSTDLDVITFAEAAQLLKSGKLSPVELTEAKLQRTETLDGHRAAGKAPVGLSGR